MPLLITYQGKSVKRRRRQGDGLRLHFYSSTPGGQSRQLVVTQQQWQQFGCIQYVPRSQMPDVRKLAGS
jgi:hypothetical protein